MVSLKRCPGCHDEYPLTADYWYRRGARWASSCKVCRKKEDKVFKQARRMKKAALLHTHRRNGKFPPEVRVVENAHGARRALRYWEHEPKSDEQWVGVGSHLLNLPDGRSEK